MYCFLNRFFHFHQLLLLIIDRKIRFLTNKRLKPLLKQRKYAFSEKCLVIIIIIIIFRNNSLL